ncbi:MAG: hypothetical protein V3G42_12425 [Oscillospiraceae bacterium]
MCILSERLGGYYKPVRITDFETEYHPDENVRELETKVHEELENHTLDSKAVRIMILDLAAKKYNCISQRGEPLQQFHLR